MFDVRRREIITMLGAAAAAWPVVARAQQTAMPVVGVLNVGTPTGLAHLMQAFHQGLAETSYVEGRNLSIQYRWAGSRNDRFPGLAAELVRSKVTVIVSLGGLPSAQAAKAATSTIPVAFYTGADPVQFGLVDSLSRPGGNSTGVTTLTAEVAPKRLELLHEVVPAARDVAALINPTNPAAESLAKDIRVAAQTFGLKVKILHASTESELNAVFSDLIKVPPGGLVIGSDPFFNTTSELLATVTARNALPAVYQYHEFVAAGGLISYGGSIADAYRRVGVYTGRLLKGEQAAELPVQQATKVELFINLKTAKALGLEVPPTLLARADEVIE